MEGWKIVFSNEAYKQYQKLPIGYRKNIDIILEKLKNREHIDIKHIKGEKNIYRVRLGKYRILFIAINEDKKYLIFRISTRGGAYKT